MPTPEPNEFLAIRDLQAALQAISVAGGYYFDMAAGAVKLDPDQDVESLIAPDGPRPVVLLEAKPDTWSTATASRPNRVEVTTPVSIHWFSDSDPNDDLSWLQTFYRGCADVEKAITADETRGGYARSTKILKRIPSYVMPGSLVWAEIEVQITSHRVYGQPS